MFNLKKSVVVGVSVTPEAGLEIAQIDYATKTVLKYGRKSVDYNIVRREIADLDLFKDSLQELLEDLAIPPGTELVLSMPTVTFKVTDYPASLDDIQIENAIEEEVYDNPFLKNYESCISYAIVNNSLQFNKVAYSAIQKSTIIELILSIKDMGYKVKTIDTSLNSMLHSLIYLERVNADAGSNWVLLTIENSCCRVLSMMGKQYLDAFEEKISIGEVLSDAENYATVIAAVEPILKNLPSKYLCIVSKTNVISAEIIANKITYSAPIIYQEANCYRKEDLTGFGPMVDVDETKAMTLDVIGAAIYPQYAQISRGNMNFFNKTLGDIYFNEQPITLMNGKLVLTNEKLIVFAILYAIIMVAFIILSFGWLTTNRIAKERNIAQMEGTIATIENYLNQHKDISAESFDEGDEIRMGLVHNKTIYSYYTIVGTEIPQKLWLTHLNLGEKTTIEGQADNIESIYGFFRNIKDYSASKDITLQKLGLASASSTNLKDFDKESLLTSLDADFYEFCISNDLNRLKTSKKEGDGDNDLLENMEPISE